MDDLAHIIGNNLAELRKRKRLTQQELSQEIGYSDKSLSKWELGNAMPHIDVLKTIADYYGVTVDFLITDGAARSKKNEIQEEKTNRNKIVITCMAATFILLCGVVIYVYNLIAVEDTKSWVYFFWCAPICFFITAFLDFRFWGRNLGFWILTSLFVWTLLLAVCLHIFIYEGDQLWYLFLVGIPVQIGIFLFSRLK